MMNDQIKYYKEHKISPETHDISDIALHYERRRKLYRQLGLPLVAFKNSKILEVGAGSGYSTLALFNFISNFSTHGGTVDILEPNERGREDMRELFDKFKIHSELYRIYSVPIENYHSDTKYDIVLCEGFLPIVDNQREVIAALSKQVKSGGVVVVTCQDAIGSFVESMKRLLAVIVTKDISDFDKKVNYLADIFSRQLKELRGVSRPTVDWVEDQLLAPMGINGNELSIEKAIDFFGDDFFVLGTSSPCMFNDYSWYKDIWYDSKADYKKQFRKKRLSLLMANMPEINLPIELADDLVKSFYEVKKYADSYEKEFDNALLVDISAILKNLSNKIDDFPKEFLDVFIDIQCAVNDAISGDVCFERYKHFNAAFGRSQQYVAFEKMIERYDYVQ